MSIAIDSAMIRSRRLERQGYHLLAFVLLGLLQYAALRLLPTGRGSVWGMTTTDWVAIAWIFAGLFQGWVAFFWRMELYGGRITARLGKTGFLIHEIGYGMLAVLRFLPVIPISIGTRGTLPVPPAVSIALIVVTTPPILWAIWSASRYFGFARAAGADHFIPAYREGKLEKHGIYKYVPNAMYSVAVLAIYHAGLLWFSTLGLIVAAAHHAFVWVHYFCTEKPDMRAIYGGPAIWT